MWLCTGVALTLAAFVQPLTAADCDGMWMDTMFPLSGNATRGDLFPLLAPLAAARGETVHIQLIGLFGTAPSATMSITLTPVVGVGVTVRAVRYVMLNTTFAGHPDGLYPDPLGPATSSPLPTAAPSTFTFAPNAMNVLPIAGSGFAAVFWVSLDVAGTAVAGNRNVHATVSVEGGGTSQCEAAFTLGISTFSLPPVPTQLTGAQFSGKTIEAFSLGGVLSPETALHHFESFAAQGITSLVWFELDQLPWAPTYSFNADHTVVTLNTTAHELWWPRVLSTTGVTRWRMPFSQRVNCRQSHRVTDNCTWTFHSETGVFEVLMFQRPAAANATVATLNPVFAQLFTVLFTAVHGYLERMAWADQAAWIQVTDEPEWAEAETARNTIALMQAYRSVITGAKIYQTRLPIITSLPVPAAAPAWVVDAVYPEVDWWCPHVCQWVFPQTPGVLDALRKKRAAAKKSTIVTVYNNGVPLIESPRQRVRYQALDVWGSNGILDGTLSWYSVNSMIPCSLADIRTGGCTSPWDNPYLPKVGKAQWPAGWGTEMYPPAPVEGGGTTDSRPAVWYPVETIRWVMLGAGVRDAEYAYALQKRAPTTQITTLLDRLRTLAPHFTSRWNPTCTGSNGTVSYGDDGYVVDATPGPDGSSAMNTWRLTAAAVLDAVP